MNDDQPNVTSWSKALEIFGDKAIGIEVASVELELPMSDGEISSYQKVPLSEYRLRQVAALGHTLVAIPPGLDLLRLRKNARHLFMSQVWEEKEPWCKISARAGYHLMSISSRSLSKTWQEQVELIPPGFETKHAVEIAYVGIASLILEHQPFFKEFVRSKDVTLPGMRMTVGVVDDGGKLSLLELTDSYRLSNTGLIYGQFLPLE